MVKRPAGLRAFLDAFDRGHLDLGALRAFTGPVTSRSGAGANPGYCALMASRLAEIFPDFTIETFRNATTSIRLIASNPNTSPTRYRLCGAAPTRNGALLRATAIVPPVGDQIRNTGSPRPCW